MKSSIKPPGGLFNFRPLKEGLIRNGGLIEREGGGIISNI